MGSSGLEKYLCGFPIWKWSAGGMAKCRNQGSNCGTAAIEAFDEAIEANSVGLVPFWRNFCGNAPNLIDIYFFSACESRLERIPACHMLVDTVAGVHAAQRKIRKIPLAGIETIPLVNENRLCFGQHKRRYVVIPVMWSPDRRTAGQRIASFPETT
jgi:hypothetical protein